MLETLFLIALLSFADTYDEQHVADNIVSNKDFANFLLSLLAQ